MTENVEVNKKKIMKILQHVKDPCQRNGVSNMKLKKKSKADTFYHMMAGDINCNKYVIKG